MRIAIFSDSFFPEMGGIQDSIYHLAVGLTRAGHAVDFYAPSASPADFEKVHQPCRELDLGPKVRVFRFFALPFPSPTQQSRVAIPTLARWRSMRAEPPDLIHTQSFLGVGLEAVRAARMLRLPLIGTNHWAVSEFSHYSPFANRLFGRLSLDYVNWYYRHCDFVTAPSRSVLEEMQALGFPSGIPMSVISNPIDTDIFRPGPAANRIRLKREFGLSAHTVAFVGRLGSEKKIDIAIRAVAIAKKSLPDLTFAIAGHGQVHTELRQLAAAEGVADSVRFVGTLPRNRVADLFRASEAVIVTSTSETQSMVLLQGMACGCPAVGVRWRALPEYIPPEVGFLAKPDDPRDVAQNILELFRDEARRKRMGGAAVKFIQRFSLPEVAGAWEKLYRTAVSAFAEKRKKL